jgi:hypothetical protein
LIVGTLVTTSALATPPSAVSAASPRRLALVIGANAAAPGRKPLRFSEQDAQAIGRVLRELGGFAQEDVSVLLDPNPDLVLKTLDALSARARLSPQETMLVFYYSGHADATALYPNGLPLFISDLRTRLADSKIGVRIGIIDACRGGGWTGAKGLSETEPFEVGLPAAFDTAGSVLISSSSGLEDAHESEAHGGSFFTHHWIAALRGAGDGNGDGQVTLHEAFDYARALTIRDTAIYTASPQHPSFSIALHGRHDLPLSQLASANALLAVDQRQGPLELIHLDSGVVVLEIPKGERSMRLAVAPGRYLLRRRTPQNTWAHELVVQPGQTEHIDEARLTLVGSPRLAIKSGAPRTLTLTTLPAHGQELTSWLGIAHGSPSGAQFGGDGDAEFGLIAPRGLTDRLQWLLPTLSFAYRAGEHGHLEWVPWGGLVSVGLGGSSIEGFVLEAGPGIGVDLRRWLGARSSLDFGAGAVSYLRWTSKDPSEAILFPDDAESSMRSARSRWTKPDTWRLSLSAGYTHTLADAVTLHVSIAASQNLLVEGAFADLSESEERSTVLGIGGVQTMGLRPTPLVRVHVRDWFSLNANAAVRYDFARKFVEETYVAGASFVW